MGHASALRAFCWIGAAVDALAVVALLSPAVSRGMLGVDAPPTSELLYAMRTGAALMLGWSLWAWRRAIAGGRSAA